MWHATHHERIRNFRFLVSINLENTHLVAELLRNLHG